jgi:hypothetical protein
VARVSFGALNAGRLNRISDLNAPVFGSGGTLLLLPVKRLLYAPKFWLGVPSEMKASELATRVMSG